MFNNSVGCRKLRVLRSPLSNSRTFSSSPKEISHSLAVTSHPLSFPRPWKPLIHSLCMNFPRRAFHVSGIIRYVVFRDSLLFPSVIFSGLLHVAACQRPTVYRSCSIVWMCPVLSIHSSVGERSGFFPCLAVVNNAVISHCIRVFVRNHYFVLVYIYWGMELLGHRVTICLTFLILKILFIYF